MFGYVRPCKPELRVKEYEAFRAMYCGLCRTLGKRYGLAWRFLLNYDFCFLALVMTDAGNCDCKACPRRCMAHPTHRRPMFEENPALDFAADATVILSYHKMLDSVRDDRGIRRLLARILAFWAQFGYRKAERFEPELALAAREGLDRLHQAERENCKSLDRAADCFASILRRAADWAKDDMTRRILEEVFYHTGRWVYIIDAWDDLEEDNVSGNYNPIRCRFDLQGKPDDTVRETVEQTLTDSAAACAAAVELMEMPRFGEIVRNVIYLGMPGTMRDVFSGKHKRREQRNGSI